MQGGGKQGGANPYHGVGLLSWRVTNVHLPLKLKSSLLIDRVPPPSPSTLYFNIF